MEPYDCYHQYPQIHDSFPMEPQNFSWDRTVPSFPNNRANSAHSHMSLMEELLYEVKDVAELFSTRMNNSSIADILATTSNVALLDELVLLQDVTETYVNAKHQVVKMREMGLFNPQLQENVDHMKSLLNSCTNRLQIVIARVGSILRGSQVAKCALEMQQPHSIHVHHEDFLNDSKVATYMVNPVADHIESEAVYVESENITKPYEVKTQIAAQSDFGSSIFEQEINFQVAVHSEFVSRSLEPENQPLHESAPIEDKSANSDDDNWNQASSTCEDGNEGSFASDFPMFFDEDNLSSSLIPEPESFLAAPTEFFLDTFQFLAAQSTLELDVMMEQAELPLAGSFASLHNVLEFGLFKESPLLVQELTLSTPSLSYLEDFPAVELHLEMLESELKSAKLEPSLEELHIDLDLDFLATDLDNFDGNIEPFSVKTEAVQICEVLENTLAAIHTELGLICASNSLEIDHASSVLPAILSATRSDLVFKVAKSLETEPAPFLQSDLSNCWYNVFSDFDGALIKKAAPKGNISAFLNLLHLLNIDSPWIHWVKYMPRHTRLLREWCKTKEFQGSQHGVEMEDDHQSTIFRSLTDDELEEHMDKTPTTEFFCNDLLWRNFQASMKPP